MRAADNIADDRENIDDPDNMMIPLKNTITKDPTIDYKKYSLLFIVKQKLDPYSINLIFGIARSIFRLTK